MFVINQTKAIKIILLFALFNNVLFSSLNLQGVSPLRVFIVLLMISAGLLIIIYFFKLFFRQTDIHWYFKIVYILFVSWCLFTIMRDISFNTKDMISLWGHFRMGWTWIIPLAIVFGFNIFNWLKIIPFMLKILFAGVILSLVYVGLGLFEAYGGSIYYFLLVLPYLFLTFFYYKDIDKIVIISGLITFMMVGILTSSRINIILFGFLLVFLVFEFFRYKKIKFYIKLLIGIVGSLLIIAMSAKLDSTIESLSDNQTLTTDTRTFLFIELLNDMSDKELLIGKGALGRYYSPFFENSEKIGLGDSSSRSSSEVGYLQMLLKGGIIMIVLYLLLFIPLAYMGMFKSKNIISRMSGYILFMNVILSILTFTPVFSIGFILLWIAAGSCISKNARETTNEELMILNKGRLIFDK